MKKNSKIFLGTIIFLIMIIYLNSYKIHIIPTETLSLTEEEKLQEYNYFWDLMKNSFPYYELSERLGVNYDILRKKFEQDIIKTTNKYEYIGIYENIIKEIDDAKDKKLGHLEVYDKDFFLANLRLYRTAKGFDTAPYLKHLKNKRTLEFYNTNYIKEIYFSESHKDKEFDYLDLNNSPEFKIIEKDKIGYIKIDSFLSPTEEIQKEFLEFYSSIKDYPYLIIDIRNNSGGSDAYWQDNIISPLIHSTLKMDNYLLYKNNRYTSEYMKIIKDRNPINSLPYLENVNDEGIQSFKTYKTTKIIVKPYDNNDRNMVNRENFILAGNNYSASESFLIFSKATNFAKIIGDKIIKSGGGIGSNPIIKSLPKSGLIIGFGLEYGLTSDGICNEEFPTEPDIYNYEGMDALETCLEYISNLK